MAVTAFLLHRYAWFGDGVLVIALMALADRHLGVSPVKFVRALLRELPELLDRKWTPGSINAFGLVTVFAFGIVAVSDVSGQLLSFLAGLLGNEKAHEYVSSVSGVTIFLALVALAWFSTFFVLLGERRRRP